MPDVVSKEVRSRMMSGIRGRDTKPEIRVRKALFARGYRYRLHNRRLPGRPDIVLARYRAAILVNGCFWHGHDCHLFKWPSTRPEFWREKIGGNVERDRKNRRALRAMGWRICVIWECALKGRTSRDPADVIDECESWLRSDQGELDIRGTR